MDFPGSFFVATPVPSPRHTSLMIGREIWEFLRWMLPYARPREWWLLMAWSCIPLNGDDKNGAFGPPGPSFFTPAPPGPSFFAPPVRAATEVPQLPSERSSTTPFGGAVVPSPLEKYRAGTAPPALAGSIPTVGDEANGVEICTESTARSQASPGSSTTPFGSAMGVFAGGCY